MKLKNAKDQQVTVKGYCIEVVKQKGYLSIQSGPGYPYVVPEDYVMATCNDDNGDEFYIIAHKSMFAGES
jgi:hypothetical protein